MSLLLLFVPLDPVVSGFFFSGQHFVETRLFFSRLLFEKLTRLLFSFVFYLECFDLPFELENLLIKLFDLCVLLLDAIIFVFDKVLQASCFLDLLSQLDLSLVPDLVSRVQHFGSILELLGTGLVLLSDLFMADAESIVLNVESL